MVQHAGGTALGAEISRATLSIEGQTVIENVSLTLTERRIGLVGLNGSGKSTLARLMCGLLKPDSGTIRIDGVDVARDRRRAIDTVGLVFQNPDHQIIFPTVEEEIAFGLRNQGLSRESAQLKTRAFLADFGRAGWAGRAVHTLSQGQRHLVCLLAAMAMRPSFLVLDEPFTGPDAPTVRQLQRELDRFEGRVLLISHDCSTLRGYDRVIWLHRGRVRQDGGAEAVLSAYEFETAQLGSTDAFADLTD